MGRRRNDRQALVPVGHVQKVIRHENVRGGPLSIEQSDLDEVGGTADIKHLNTSIRFRDVGVVSRERESVSRGAGWEAGDKVDVGRVGVVVDFEERTEIDSQEIMADLADFQGVRIDRIVQILEEHGIGRIAHVDYRLDYPASAAGIGVYYDIGDMPDDLHAICLRI